MIIDENHAIIMSCVESQPTSTLKHLALSTIIFNINTYVKEGHAGIQKTITFFQFLLLKTCCQCVITCHMHCYINF